MFCKKMFYSQIMPINQDFNDYIKNLCSELFIRLSADIKIKKFWCYCFCMKYRSKAQTNSQMIELTLWQKLKL